MLDGIGEETMIESNRIDDITLSANDSMIREFKEHGEEEMLKCLPSISPGMVHHVIRSIEQHGYKIIIPGSWQETLLESVEFGEGILWKF